MRRISSTKLQRYRRKRLFISVLILTVTLLASRDSYGQGWLRMARNDVRNDDPDPPSEEQPKKSDDNSWQRPRDSRTSLSDSSSGSSYFDDEPAWTAESVGFVLMAAGIAATTPFWGPRSLIDDEGLPAMYPHYPYEDDLPGYAMIESYAAEPFGWSTRLSADYVDNFDDLNSFGGHLLFETSSRFGVDTATSYRREELSPPGMTDDLWTGDVNLTYRFAQSEHWQFRAGLGMNWLADSIGGDIGYNLTYSVDWFPRRPWIVTAEVDWGDIGHAHLLHLRSTIGWQFHGVELYTGYDYYDLGKAHLDGLIAGLQFWF